MCEKIIWYQNYAILKEFWGCFNFGTLTVFSIMLCLIDYRYKSLLFRTVLVVFLSPRLAHFLAVVDRLLLYTLPCCRRWIRRRRLSCRRLGCRRLGCRRPGRWWTDCCWGACCWCHGGGELPATGSWLVPDSGHAEPVFLDEPGVVLRCCSSYDSLFGSTYIRVYTVI